MADSDIDKDKISKEIEDMEREFYPEKFVEVKKEVIQATNMN